MKADRRHLLTRAGRWAVAGGWALTGLRVGRAATPGRVAIAVPGPGNLLFLPVTLASRISADHVEGLELDLQYVGGGPQAFRAMLDGSCDFSAGGFSALALQKINGQPVKCIAPLTRVPAYTLLVRSAFRGKVRKIGDLRGLVIGVKGHVPGGRSTTQLFTEHLLDQAGISPTEVNYVPAGQSFESQYAALASGSVDALMGDEPFATRMVRQKVAYVLADFHDLQTTRKEMGGLFLNGMIATRDDVIVRQPELVEKMVKTVQRTLDWIARHSARQMVDALGPAGGEEAESLWAVLRRRKNIYNSDARFSQEQLGAAERFLHASEKTTQARAFRVAGLVDDRWAGSAP